MDKRRGNTRPEPGLYTAPFSNRFRVGRRRSAGTHFKNGDAAADPQRLRRHVEFLADEIGARPYSEPGRLKAAAEHLSALFKDFGYSVCKQPFTYRGNTYFNICASPGSFRDDAEHPILVVGAHYDTVARTPGADDNASGVAGLIELARLLAPAPPSTLRMVAFCLEEPPVFRTANMGSYRYAKDLKKKGKKVRGMICLEMIGCFSDRPKSQSFPFFFMDRFYPSTGNFIALAGNRRSARWTKEVKKAFSEGTDLPIESINAPAIVVGVDMSDHWSFNRFRYPAVMVTDTAFYRNPNYHTPYDTPETLDYARAALVVDGVASAVLALG